MRFKKTFSDRLTRRYQLVIRDEASLAEKSAVSFSYAKLIALGTTLLGILLMCSLALATTFLAKWLNPAYVEQENKKKLLQLAIEVDTLEQQTAQQKRFIALLQSIIAGKEPPPDELPTVGKEQTRTVPVPRSAAQPADADMLLRSESENSEVSPSTAHHKPMKNLQQLVFFPLVSGIVTIPFKHSTEHYGVNAVVKEHEPIKCVSDGVVIFSAWTVVTGWVIVVQHNNDLISIYKHNEKVFKKVNNFAEKGEVIAIMGNSSRPSAGSHPHFGLWHEGRAVSPERFVTF